MTFQAEYPDLTGLTMEQQIDELFNRFISLSRQVEYAVSHIDSKNLTSAFHKRLADEAGNVSELMRTAEELSLSIENKADKAAAYYSFDSENLNIYSGGIKIFNGTPEEPGDAVFYADENGSLRLRDVLLEDLGGNIQAGVDTNGIHTKSIRFGGFMDDKIYARITSYDHFILGGGAYGLSFIGSNPSQDHGLEFYSDYTRTISSSTGIPSDTEKKKHSGVSLHGDVVISNFGDDYYRYPVVADANYKYRVYLEDTGALVVARYNAKTNKLKKTCKFTPTSII